MSDHIEAAIVTLPIVGLYGLLVWCVPYMAHVRLPKWLFWVLLVAGVGMAAYVIPDRFTVWGVVGLAVCYVISSAGLILARRRIFTTGLKFPNVNPSLLLFYTITVRTATARVQ